VYGLGVRTLLIAVLLCAACARREVPSAKPAPSSSVARAAASAEIPPDAGVAGKLSETQVRELVEAWLAAQNSGDFKAYEKLYASRFTGVKRSGTYTRSFRRPDWLKDRAGMFSRKMTVSIDKLKVMVSDGAARVSFEQTWASGDYKDVGPKQMVIVPTPEGPRITREEMLASIVANAPPPGPAKDWFLADADGVILRTSAEQAWSSSAPRFANEETVVSDVAEPALPEIVRAQKGRRLRVHSESGAVCETKITGFKLRAQIVPHFGMRQGWRGESGEPKTPQVEIAREIWELAGQDGLVLLGEIEPKCSAPLWAEDAAAAPIALARIEKASSELGALALAALRRSPEYAATQREFEGYPGATGPWERAGERAFDAWRIPRQVGSSLVVASLRAGEGCAFSAGLTALFEQQGPRTPLVVLAIPDALRDGFEHVPKAAFDADGDGSLEILFGPDGFFRERSVLGKRGQYHELEVLLRVPYLDCPC